MKEIDLGHNSKCLKCGKQLCGCEFRQPKTWQEDFDEKFVLMFGLEPYIKVSPDKIIQFITDLRKHDEEELIKMLDEVRKESIEPVNNKEEEIQFYADTHFNCGVSNSKQLIKDYYAK